LLPGDVILAIDGVQVSDRDALRPAIAKDAGRDAEITVFRKGHRITKKVHLAAETW
jgi:S1-C subfamily serine protease